MQLSLVMSGSGGNALLAQWVSADRLQFAEGVMMAAGAVALVASLIVQFIRRGRWLPWSFHRRTSVPFEAILFPAIAFFFVAATMQLLLPAGGTNNDGQQAAPAAPASGHHTDSSDHPHDADHGSSATIEPTDLQRNVLITNVAMIAGAIAAYVVARRCLASRTRGVIWLRRRPTGQIFDGVVGALSAFALCYAVYQVTLQVLVALNPDFAPSEHVAIEALQSSDQPGWLRPVVWIGTCIVAPVAEELFFRGLIQTMLLRAFRKRWVAIVLTAAIFGGAHMSQPQSVPAIFVFGLILGILYERRAALAGPMIAHALFNAKTILWLTLSAG